MSARRELDRAFAPLGYEYQGVNGNGHWVWTHPNGATMRAGKDLSGRKLVNYRNIAKRNVGYADAKSQRYIRFVFDSFNVGEREQRDVQFQMSTMTQAFKSANPDAARWSIKAPQMALRHSPLVQYLGGGKGGTMSRFRLTGRLFEVDAQEEPDVVVRDGDERDAVGGVVPVDHPEGADASPVGADGGGESAELGDDPVVDEPDRPVVVVAAPSAPNHAHEGMVLSDALVNQLRDALGAGGDVEAENALLRETLTNVLGSLHAASEAVEAALSLHTPKPNPTRKGRLGPKRMRQLHELRAVRDTMPDTFSADTIERMLGVGHHEAANILNSFKLNGHLVRVNRGVYRWADR